MNLLFLCYTNIRIGGNMRKKQKRTSSKWFLVVILFLSLVGIVLCSQTLFQKQEIMNSEKPKIQVIDEESKSRPYAVMINNLSVARKYHSGLQDAYLVYEMIVEGGITRFLAIFQDTNTSVIGPIRSARPYYLDYVMEHDAYFVHWGFSEEAKKDIKTYGIQNLNGLYQDRYFWKDRTLPVATEHTAFTSMEKLKQGIHDSSYRNIRKGNFLFSYSSEEVNLEEGSTANVIEIPYSNSSVTSYRYNQETKLYERFVNQEPHVDYVTKKQYTAKNIITYQVKNTSIDSYGRQKLDTVSKGEGYYITNGVAKKIMFEKTSRSGKTKYTYLDGTEVVLNDGNTWIQIQPTSQSFIITE